MSRRKQLNPKPLLKSECQESSEEMTIEKKNANLCEPNLSDENMRKSGSNSPPIPEKCTNQNLDIQNCPSDDVKESPHSNDNNSNQLDSPKLPKLRLNALLASDPALKPQAKNLQITFEEFAKKDDSPNIPNCKIDESNSSKSELSNNLLTISQSQKVKVFMCVPCGIGFSSVSTLEAHQAYYCSHRDDNEDDTPTNSGFCNDKNAGSGEPLSKSLKTGKMFACLQCSYSADKKVSLNRHMRMHQISPTPSSNASNGDDNSSQHVDRYCSECDIKFSNIKTYRAHKQHYCNSRRKEASTTPKNDSKNIETLSPQRRLNNSPQQGVNMLQPFLALPTNPILVIPYSLIQGASIISDPQTILSSGSDPGTCYSLENGSLKAVAAAITNQTTSESIQLTQTSPICLDSPENDNKIVKNRKYEELTKKICRENTNKETIPLDLSFRRFPKTKQNQLIIDCKENISINQEVFSPEQIICAPSLPSSPSLSPSPKRQALSPRSDSTGTSLGIHSLERLPLTSVLKADIALKLTDSKVAPFISKKNLELALKLSSNNKFKDISNPISTSSIPTSHTISTSMVSSTSPQIYVKQGVSKCKECNIVFCKYENYLVHKQHYCSSRNLDDSDNCKNSSRINLNSVDSGIPSVSYQQLICAACGIKYTSLDNLRAHQSYYCPKGVDAPAQIAIEKEKCERCKSIHETGTPCATISQTTYKCAVCSVVSTSAMENRKHMETHGTVKAFRCSVCRYKGNTLRGMRTHIRMHFDKKGSDFNEENYMSCLLEEDGIEISTLSSLDQPDSQLSQQLYNCDICNYSSSYKGNVIRHMKLVHAQQELEEDPENYSQTCGKIDLPGQVSDEPNENIKIEPLEINNCNNIKTEYEEASGSFPEAVLSCTSQLIEEENFQKNSGQKYCETCDIKFNYMKSYIAHKQFYCKSKQNENESPSPVSIQSPTLLNRNKENMETVI